jgi:hypothetical protein
MMLTKLLLDKETNNQPRAARLLENLSEKLALAYPDAAGFKVVHKPENWAKQAMKLKQMLMISYAEYRVRFILPGCAFDSEWMEGITVDGRPFRKENAGTLKVALCLFPGIAEYHAQPLEEDASIAEALTTNKKFFLSPTERLTSPKSCIAKAHVLLM